MPEVLHLLLELSNKPVQNTSLADVESLKPPDVYEEKTWKWNELVREEPLLRDKIWRNIDYAVESSDEESWESSDIGLTQETDTSVGSTDDEPVVRLEDFAIPVEKKELEMVQEGQFWKKIPETPTNIVDAYFDRPEPVRITEFQAIRESLFMLRGLPTTLYTIEENVSARLRPVGSPETFDSIIIRPVPGFSLSTIQSEILYQTLTQFAEYGSTLSYLRKWTPLEIHEPLMRRIQQEIRSQIQLFDDSLTTLESKYLDPKISIITSLAEVQTAIVAKMSLYQQLHNLVLDKHKSVQHRWLEAFFSASCVAQITGNSGLYTTLGSIFFSILSIYLRPLRRWMEDGETSPNFFIEQVVDNSKSLSLWERFSVSLNAEGHTKNTARFLHVAMNKILTSGKSVLILKKLGRYEAMRVSWTISEPALTFEEVCGEDETGLLPFEELFNSTFARWVEVKHHSTSSMLRHCLFAECGLSSTLAALERVYFLSDGATASAFTTSIFESLRRGKEGWNDAFTVTELARETIGQLDDVDAEHIRVATIPSALTADVSVARRTVKSLSSISLTYRIPWAVSLIIRPQTLPTYRRISTFLLQTRFATTTLTSSRLLSTSEPPLYYGVRAKLLWFSSTLYKYLTDDVLVTNVQRLGKEMGEARDVDGMLGAHNDFVRRLHDQLLLGKRLELIHKSILQILDLALALEDARTRGESGAVAETATKDDESDSNFESSDDEEKEDGEGISILPERNDQSYDGILRSLNSDYGRLSLFVQAGLSGVARTGKEEMWDVLAEKLESGMRGGEVLS